MPLLFPIAKDARSALDSGEGARTSTEAGEKAGGPVTLVSEWLRPAPAERDALQSRAEAGVAQGFVQLYEDAKGRPVLAVTFWKRKIAAPPPAPDKAAPKAPAEDHTDDLYFAKPSSRTRRTKRAPDPDQLDLFGKRLPDPASGD